MTSHFKLLSLGLLLISSVQAATNCDQVTEISVAECQDLLALYQQTQGTQWTYNDGWNETDTPCDWYGVSCNALGVEQIDLSDNQLNGTLPIFNALTYLQILDLSFNQLQGPIPAFNALTALHTLRLSSNQLSGTLPNFSQLTNLKKISLAANQLTVARLADLGLSQCEEINLASNQLTGRLVDFLQLGAGQYPLWQLDLSNNQLCGEVDFAFFESLITNLSIDYSLYLEDNHLVFNGEFPVAFNTMLPGWQNQKPPLPQCVSTFPLTLTLSGTGTGIVTAPSSVGEDLHCGSVCTAHYPQNSLVTLTATPATGSFFAGWQGGCSNNYWITAPTTCTALFERIPVNSTESAGFHSAPLDTISFKSSVIGQATQKNLILVETGGTTLQVDFKALRGSADFTILTPLPLLISDGQPPIPLTLQCTPSSVGPRTAVLKLTTNAPEQPNSSYLLTCSGQLPAGYLSDPPPDALLDLGSTLVNRATSADIQIETAGLEEDTAHLVVDLLAIEGPDADSFAVITPSLPLTLSDDRKTATVRIRCHPVKPGLHTATLRLTSNDPNHAEIAYPLTCTSTCYADMSAFPQQLDFGVETVGGRAVLQQHLYWTVGCEAAVVLEDIVFTPPEALQVENKHCTTEKNRQHCQADIVFMPISAGLKEASLHFVFADPTVSAPVIPIRAQATDAQPDITITPQHYDFGALKASRGPSDAQDFVVTNTGQANLHLENIELIGVDAADFSLQTWDCDRRYDVLKPTEACHITVSFTPWLTTSMGDKQAALYVISNAGDMITHLTGYVEETANCATAHVTLTSVQSGVWHAVETWSAGRLPTETDVVLIQSGHEIIGPTSAIVKALCIAADATLISADDRGTPLEIQATDYLENSGQILGRAGADEADVHQCQEITAVDTPACAQSGASVILKVGSGLSSDSKMGAWWWYGNGGPLLNAGIIKAGAGGQGYRYGAPGGNAIVLGRNTVNTQTIEAGKGETSRVLKQVAADAVG